MVASLALAVMLAGAPTSQSGLEGRAGQASQVDETAPVEVPPATERAMQYYRSGNILWVLNLLVSIGVLVVLLATGASAKLRDLSRRIGRKWFFTLVIYFLLFNLVTSIVELPLVYYQEYVREHAYGLSNQTIGKWWGDTVKAFGVSCVVGALILWVPYLLLRKSPRRRWLYTGLAMVPFILVGNLVAPIWIAPLFNKFEPMRDKGLEQQILSMADRAGIEGSRVFEVNKSVDTKTLNAYVAGIFNTKRIVLWDTIIKRMTTPELLFVMGH